LPAAQRFSSSVGIVFGGGFSSGFVLLRRLRLPVAAVAIMTLEGGYYLVGEYICEYTT